MDNNAAVTKDDFNATVSSINAMLARHDDVYPQLIATVSRFDKALASKIAACAAADADLAQYLKTKVESGENRGLVATVVGLLLGR
jgi:hypothetical protein